MRKTTKMNLFSNKINNKLNFKIMKKFFLSSMAILAIAAMAAFNVNVNSQENGLSDVSLANVEALAFEFIYIQDSADVYDKTNDCFLQCVISGGGCAYVYNLGNAC